MKKINRRKQLISEDHLIDNDFYEIIFSRSPIQEQTIKHHIDTVIELSESKRFMFLMNFEESDSEIEFEALRAWSADKTLIQKRIAEAYVVKSLAGRISIAQHIRLNKPSYEVKIFQTVEDAKNWLMEVKQIQEK